MATDDNLSTQPINFNRFDWNAAPEPWRSIGLAWRDECLVGIFPAAPRPQIMGRLWARFGLSDACYRANYDRG